MEELLKDYPVLLRKVSVGGGRGVFAKRFIKSGEKCFQSAPACMSVHRKHYPLFCLNCCKFSEDVDQQLRYRCELCKTAYYCSEQCKKSDYHLHFVHCEFLQAVEKDKKIEKRGNQLG